MLEDDFYEIPKLYFQYLKGSVNISSMNWNKIKISLYLEFCLFTNLCVALETSTAIEVQCFKFHDNFFPMKGRNGTNYWNLYPTDIDTLRQVYWEWVSMNK